MTFDKLKDRLQALRAKTVANGCTEAEALAAAEKVAELIDRYHLSVTDLALSQEVCERGFVEVPRKQRQAAAVCAGAIAAFCDCRVWLEPTGTTAVRLVFFGLRTGVDTALCLAEMAIAALHTEWQRYREGQRFLRYGDDNRGSFQFGMAVTLADRLAALKADRVAITRGSGRDLMLVRTGVVEAAFAKLGLDLRAPGGSNRKVAVAAFEAGQAAGAEVAIDPARRR